MRFWPVVGVLAGAAVMTAGAPIGGAAVAIGALIASSKGLLGNITVANSEPSNPRLKRLDYCSYSINPTPTCLVTGKGEYFYSPSDTTVPGYFIGPQEFVDAEQENDPTLAAAAAGVHQIKKEVAADGRVQEYASLCISGEAASLINDQVTSLAKNSQQVAKVTGFSYEASTPYQRVTKLKEVTITALGPNAQEFQLRNLPDSAVRDGAPGFHWRYPDRRCGAAAATHVELGTVATEPKDKVGPIFGSISGTLCCFLSTTMAAYYGKLRVDQHYSTQHERAIHARGQQAQAEPAQASTYVTDAPPAYQDAISGAYASAPEVPTLPRPQTPPPAYAEVIG